MRKLDIPFSVVVNRVTESENLITEYCRAEKLEILLQIPQSRQVAEAYSRGEDILKALPELKVVLLEMIENIKLKAIKHQQGESQ
jgi:MinD superfamily P-loop ATPase